MKNIHLLPILIFGLILFQNCTPNPVLDPVNEWDTICEDLNNGTITMQIDGKSWTSSCISAGRVFATDSLFTYDGFTLVAYNNGIRFFTDSEIEAVVLSFIEIDQNGVKETVADASFFDGFYDASRLNDPEYELTGQSYFSDEDENTGITLSSINDEGAKGTFKIDLFEEDSNEKITMEGSFDIRFNE